MTSTPATFRVEIRHGRRLLFGPSVRAAVVDTLFEIGHSAEDAAALWTAATTATGPHGDRARRLIEEATDIRITVETAPF
jgi:hypothetical protein